MWSTDLYLVTLLDEYVAPQTVVSDYVRKQLLRQEEENSIRQAIENRQEGQRDINDTYERWLWYSGIDFETQALNLRNIIARGDLLRALFDLTLDQSVRHMLNHYTEFHEARRTIQLFFTKFANRISEGENPDGLWWDGAFVSQSPDKRWISVSLKNHSSFLPILESWLSDSDYLQSWLRDYEAETPLVNNPRGENRVFSESIAMGVLQFIKVRYLNAS